MNRVVLAKAGIDVANGIRRFGGKKELYEKYLCAFEEDPNYGRLEQAIQEKDVEEAFSSSHALKGMAGNLGLQELYEALVPLVEIFRAGEITEDEGCFETVKTCYQNTIQTIRVAKQQKMQEKEIS